MMLLSSKNLLDYVQNHSSNLRSGLDYTNMYLVNIIGFKRPKLKSATRMVNYDFDQIDRFLNYAKFFLSPSLQSWDVQSVFDYYIINKITT